MKLAWDSENLFVAYYVEDTEQTFTALNQDGYIFQKDDLVEFFIDPDGDGVNYIEVGVNGLNVYYDFIIKCPGGDCGAWSDDQVFDLQGFESAVTKDNSQYTVEIKIPFTALNAVTDGGFTTPMDGDSWKANFFRIDQTSGASAEYQAWNSHESFGYHQPSKFGTITFKEVFTSSTSIANIVNVYPNPTSGRLNISKEVDTITVTDVTGATVISENNTSSIDLSSYTSGIYTVNIETADQVITQKVIVE